MNTNSPILFLIFNRPDTTKIVFERIREAQPKQLFIAADGPRANFPSDIEQCELTRQIVNMIDWECEVHLLFRASNLGCKKGVSSAINWFFENVEQGIILEDDCVPHPSFFRYCEELLNYYMDNPNIMVISGDNFLFGKVITNASYFFTKYAHIWGWATWKRAWLRFHEWENNPIPIDMGIFKNRAEKKFWRQKLLEIKNQKMIYTWDYQWALVCMAYKSLCICPNLNLVSNIGFGLEGTNTKSKSIVANIPSEKMNFPLIHPKELIWNDYSDRQSAKLFFQYSANNFLNRVKLFLRSKI